MVPPSGITILPPVGKIIVGTAASGVLIPLVVGGLLLGTWAFCIWLSSDND
jgi:hypothetical protein